MTYGYTFHECRPSGGYRHAWMTVRRLDRFSLPKHLQAAAESGDERRISRAMALAAAAAGRTIYIEAEEICLQWQAGSDSGEKSEWYAATMDLPAGRNLGLARRMLGICAAGNDYKRQTPAEIVAALKAIPIRSASDSEDRTIYAGGYIAYFETEAPELSALPAQEAVQV